MPRSLPRAQASRQPVPLAVSLLVALIACLALTVPALGQDFLPGLPAGLELGALLLATTAPLAAGPLLGRLPRTRSAG